MIVDGLILTKVSYTKDGVTKFIYDVLACNTVLQYFSDVEYGTNATVKFTIDKLPRDTRLKVVDEYRK